MIDVAIIGGGVSGLAAARELVSAGLEVRVLEARQRPGGRTMLTEVGGVTVDQGGQWIGPGHDDLRALLEELGIGTNLNPSWSNPESAHVWQFGDTRTPYAGDMPPLSEAALTELATVQAGLEQLAEGIPLEAPWVAESATALDAVTLDGWLAERVRDPQALYFVRFAFALSCGAPAAQMSLLYAAWFVRGAGGFEAMLAAEVERIDGGAGGIAERLAAELGERVELEWPVRAVIQGEDRVSVEGGDGRSLDARRVIVAMSPTDAGRIEFTPRLPAERQLLQTNWQQYPATKFHAVYERPFWREQGLSGAVCSDLPSAPVVFDDSPPDGSHGVLVGLAAVHGGRLPLGLPAELLDDDARRHEAVLDALVRYFGEEARQPLEFVERHWSYEPYIAGVIGATAPGLLSACGPALRRPADRIHWAGTEAATQWSGWISGAVQAGQRAAGEVIAALGRTVDAAVS